MKYLELETGSKSSEWTFKCTAHLTRLTTATFCILSALTIASACALPCMLYSNTLCSDINPSYNCHGTNHINTNGHKIKILKYSVIENFRPLRFYCFVAVVWKAKHVRWQFLKMFYFWNEKNRLAALLKRTESVSFDDAVLGAPRKSFERLLSLETALCLPKR